MNLDTFTNNDKIYRAVKRVRLSEKGGRWVLLGYVDKVRKCRLMTVCVKEEGTGWSDLLDSFEDDKIQYGYAKLDYEGSSKLLLIHWVGKEVAENEKSSFMPHLNEIRNLVLEYDFTISSMDTLDIHCKVQNVLSRKQMIDVQSGDFSDWDKCEFAYAQPKRFATMQRKKKRRQNKEPLTSSVKVTKSLCQFNLNKISPVTLPKVKIAIIGSAGVGKTHIYMNYNQGYGALSLPGGAPCTIGADFMSKDVRLSQHMLTLEIWDTAGQETYASLTSFWTRNAKVVICVYDIADAMSYNEIPKHMQAAKEYADSRAIFFLVGNKADLVHRREVRETEAQKFAARHGMIFMECSGLTGLNILKLFESITKHVVFTYQDIFTSHDESSNDIIRLTESTMNSRHKSKRGCQQCQA